MDGTFFQRDSVGFIRVRRRGEAGSGKAEAGEKGGEKRPRNREKDS